MTKISLVYHLKVCNVLSVFCVLGSLNVCTVCAHDFTGQLNTLTKMAEEEEEEEDTQTTDTLHQEEGIGKVSSSNDDK